MKLLTTGILTLLLSSAALAGNGTEGINPTKRVFEKWQKNAFLYPEASLKENAKGIVFVSFKLDENGEMTQVAVVQGISPELDKKALEIAKNMPTNHLLSSDYEADKEFILPVKFSIR